MYENSHEGFFGFEHPAPLESIVGAREFFFFCVAKPLSDRDHDQDHNRDDD